MYYIFLKPKDVNESSNLTKDPKHSYITELYQVLPDKGSFLADQPVPRDGSFYIVLLRPNDTALCPESYISAMKSPED